MKVNVEVDCTPEEARRFLGLPDVTQLNEEYTANLSKLIQGAGNLEQMQELGKQIAPMGQMGMQLFQQMVEAGAKSPFSAAADKDKAGK